MQSTSRQKYMEFLPLKKRTHYIQVRKPISSFFAGKNCVDFVKTCSQDLLVQLDILSNEKKLDRMYIEIIDKSLHYGKKLDLNEFGERDYIEFSALHMFQKLRIEIEQNPEIEKELMSRITSVYLSKCMELGLDPKPMIISRLF
jgi:hypothetical protein